MDFTLDHLVYAVPDLGAATEHFGTREGLHVVPGGSHPQWGTHNALAYFGLPYLEFIAVKDASVAVNSTFGASVLTKAQAGGGLVTFALGAANLDGAVASLREQGVAVEGPTAASRTRPDGSVVAWRLAFPGPAGALPMPFLIEWQQSDAEREADLTARGAIKEEDLRLGLVVAVRSLDTALQAYARYLGITARPNPTHEGGRRAQLNLRRGEVELWESDLVPEGPYQVTLSSAAGVLRRFR